MHMEEAFWCWYSGETENKGSGLLLCKTVRLHDALNEFHWCIQHISLLCAAAGCPLCTHRNYKLEADLQFRKLHLHSNRLDKEG